MIIVYRFKNVDRFGFKLTLFRGLNALKLPQTKLFGRYFMGKTT